MVDADNIIRAQKRILDKLNSLYKKPILVAHTQKNSNRPSQWIPLKEAELPVDYYIVLSNQLILERDEGGWGSIYEYHLKIDRFLRRKAIPYLLSDTGGKGLHHELFFKFDDNDIDRIEKAKEEGMDNRFVRMFLADYQEKEAGIPKDAIGDRSCVGWSEERKGHLIRVWGGKKCAREGTLLGYKTLIDGVPKQKKRVTAAADVRFPTEIKLWIVPPMAVDELLKAWVNSNTPEKQREREAIEKSVKEFEGRHSELPCVKLIQVQGAPVGQRNKVAMILISAYVLDKVPKSGIYWAVDEFYKNCPDQSDLNADELHHIVDWFLNKGDVFWECYTPIKRGYCVEGCEMKYNVLTLVDTTPTSLVYRKRNLILEIGAIKIKDEGVSCIIMVFCQSSPFVQELRHKDKISLWSSRERTKFVNKVYKKTASMNKDDLEQTVLELEGRLIKDFEKQKRIMEQLEEEKKKLTDREKEEAIKVLKTPKLLYELNQIIGRLGVGGDDTNRLTIYICGTSRLLDNPISLIVKGESASGKSYPIQKIIMLFPQDSYRDLTDVTAQSLLYLGKNDLKHKWLIIFERHGSEKADYTIRSMQSEKKLKILTVMKTKGGQLESTELEVEGPVSTTETTTQSIIQPENETRLLSIYTDESAEQTKRTFQVTSAKYQIGINKIEEETVKKWKSAQRALQPYRVHIPFVPLLEKTFPLEPVRVRRDYPRFLSVIEVVTFLHQYQRPIVEIEGEKYVVATLADYYITKVLIESSLARTITQIPPRSEELLGFGKDLEKKHRVKELEDQAVDEEEIEKETFEFTRKDLEKATGWSNDVVSNWTKPLVNGGFFDVVQGGKGKRYRYRLTDKNPENLRLPPIPDVRKWIFENIDVLHPKVKELITSELPSDDEYNYMSKLVGDIYDPITGEPKHIPAYCETEPRKSLEVEDIKENKGLDDDSTSEMGETEVGEQSETCFITLKILKNLPEVIDPRDSKKVLNLREGDIIKLPFMVARNLIANRVAEKIEVDDSHDN